MSYGNSDGSDGSSAGGYGGDSSSSCSAGGYGGDSSSSSSAGGYGGSSSSSSSSGSCGEDSSSSSSSGNFGSDSSSSSSNDDSNSNSSGVDSTSDSNDNSDSGSSSDSSNVNSDSSAAAENDSSIDSNNSLTGAQLDGSAGNSLNPSEGIVGGTPYSDELGSNYNSSTYSGISLDGAAGASLASSEPATAYSFSGYISDNYDSAVASSYQSTMDMSGFQNTEVTEPSLLGSAWNSVAQWAEQNVVQPIQAVYNDYVVQPLNNVESAIGNIYNDNVEPTISSIEADMKDINNNYVTQPLNNMREAYQMAMSTTGTLPSAGEVASQINDIADGTSGGVQVQVDNDNHLAIVDPDSIQKQYSTDADLVEGLVDGKITIDDVQKNYDTEGLLRDYDPNRDRIDYFSASIGASAWKCIGGNVNITMDVNGHVYAGGSFGPGEGPVTPVAVSVTQGRIDMEGIKADPDAVRNFCDGYSATAYVGVGLGGAKTVSLPSGVTATEEGFVVGIGAQGAYMQEVKAVTPEEFQEKIQGWESDLQEIQSDIPIRQSSYLKEGDVIEALDSGKATWNELDINGVLKDSR